ncbi:winged helix-turn-helix transcriptional regulator [Halorientalis salina]|uniref:winged helix-turn-helix transcriptional regulator n=1 Tax=Halorientalis salina TaxID=2932266 RepID=UPI0010AC7A28|nr:winged helix-turn-helix transcriptional regulator [Halorientalis salina]
MVEEGVDESKRSTLRRFAAIGAAGPLSTFRSSDDAEAESDTRDALAGYIAATPGAHFSKIRDDLQLGTGETQHHLRRLRREDAIETRKDGDYSRFFPAGRFSAFEQVALGYLRRETPRGMLITLLRTPDVTGAELADEVGVSAPTISNYAGELADAGLLTKEDGYTVENPEVVLLLLVRYADSFDADTTELAADAADLLQYEPR